LHNAHPFKNQGKTFEVSLPGFPNFSLFVGFHQYKPRRFEFYSKILSKCQSVLPVYQTQSSPHIAITGDKNIQNANMPNKVYIFSTAFVPGED